MEVIRAVLACCEHTLPRANGWASPIGNTREIIENPTRSGCTGLEYLAKMILGKSVEGHSSNHILG